jgi:hypothetical protein
VEFGWSARMLFWERQTSIEGFDEGSWRILDSPLLLVCDAFWTMDRFGASGWDFKGDVGVSIVWECLVDVLDWLISFFGILRFAIVFPSALADLRFGKGGDRGVLWHGDIGMCISGKFKVPS